MPNLNRTGPEGLGPMTGRRMGRCTHFGEKRQNQPEKEPEERPDSPDEYGPMAGRGPGWGLGRGRGIGPGRGWRGQGRGGRGRGLGMQNRFRGNF